MWLSLIIMKSLLLADRVISHQINMFAATLKTYSNAWVASFSIRRLNIHGPEIDACDLAYLSMLKTLCSCVRQYNDGSSQVDSLLNFVKPLSIKCPFPSPQKTFL